VIILGNMDDINPQYTNFPFGPVPLSPTWKKYSEAGYPETQRTEKDVRGQGSHTKPGFLTPAPMKLSSRSLTELTSKASAPSGAVSLHPVLDDRLYLMVMPDGGKRGEPPRRIDPNPRACYYYFTTEKSLKYYPFSQDFGPLNLGQTVKFIRRLNVIINNYDHARCRIVHYCPNRPDRISNAVVLLAVYLLAVVKMPQKQILEKLKDIPFKPYRDASYGSCSYKMTLADCIGGIGHAISLSWFDWPTFDLDFYEHYEMIDRGDLNWTIPNKFIAFSSPMMERYDPEGYLSNTPNDYLKPFTSIGVTDIVRLNDNQYDRNIFLRAGFKHHDLTYPDGSIPDDRRIQQFLDIAEKAEGVVAVHCKAGLGRTGSMIGVFAIRHFGWTGRNWIAWNRICRPGSVLGPQQQWLTNYEVAWKESNTILPTPTHKILVDGDAHSPRGTHGGVRSPINPQTGKQARLEQMPTTYAVEETNGLLTDNMRDDEKKIAVEGDHGQADRLMNAKRRNDAGFASEVTLPAQTMRLMEKTPAIPVERVTTTELISDSSNNAKGNVTRRRRKDKSKTSRSSGPKTTTTTTTSTTNRAQ